MTSTQQQKHTYSASYQTQGSRTQSSPHDLNCPCCNLRIVGEVNYNMSNQVEVKEVKKSSASKSQKTSSQHQSSPQISNRPYLPNARTVYCSIPGCQICSGKPQIQQVQEETYTKVIIHRDISHESDFQCQFCDFCSADYRLLQLIQQHHERMAALKRSLEGDSSAEKNRSQFQVKTDQSHQHDEGDHYQSPFKHDDIFEHQQDTV